MNNDKKQNKDNNKSQVDNCPTQEPVIGARTAGTAEGDEKTIDKALQNVKSSKS